MISSRRHFVYKKAPSIKNIIAQVSSRRPLSPYPILWQSSVNWKGCFSPKRKMCPYVHRQKLSTDLNGKEYFISKFFTCSTEFELYGLTCPYSFLYMGRTMRARFVDHQKLIKDGNVDHDVPRHFAPPPQRWTLGLGYGACSRWNHFCWEVPETFCMQNLLDFYAQYLCTQRASHHLMKYFFSVWPFS